MDEVPKLELGNQRILRQCCFRGPLSRRFERGPWAARSAGTRGVWGLAAPAGSGAEPWPAGRPGRRPTLRSAAQDKEGPPAPIFLNGR